MRARRGEDKHQRAVRKAGEDYPKSRADNSERLQFDASKYIPGGKHRTVPLGNH